MGAILRYNLYRFGLLAAFLLVGYLVGLVGVALVVVSVLGSGITSYFALKPQRLAMIAEMQRRVEQRQARSAARAAREDAWDEQRRAEEEIGPDDLAG